MNSLSKALTVDEVRLLRNGGRNADPEFSWTLLRTLASRDSAAIEKYYKSCKSVTKAAMTETNGLRGGYAVPTEYSTLLLTSVDENSFFRERAMVVPMTSGETRCPAVTPVTPSAGQSPFFGGISFGWGQGVNETTLGQSEPTFNEVSLRPCDLIGQLVVSNQFLYDIGAEGEKALTRLFGRAAAWHEEYAFLRGTGAANLQPLGILNAPSAKLHTRGGAGHITVDDIAGMAAKMLPLSWGTSIWACNPTALADIMSIDGFTPNMEIVHLQKGCMGILHGRPVFVTEKLPPLGTAGDLIYFDPSLYVIGDRQQVVIDTSTHATFRTNQTVFRVWLRVDGKPVLEGSVTLTDTSTSVSPYVVLN